MPITYIPAPTVRPTTAENQSTAAVVSPRTVLPFLKMTPAPRKPIPLTTWAARRAGSEVREPSRIPPRSAKPYLDTIMHRAAPQQTTMCVRTPASLKRLLLSMPMSMPRIQDTASLQQQSSKGLVAISKDEKKADCISSSLHQGALKPSLRRPG